MQPPPSVVKSFSYVGDTKTACVEISALFAIQRAPWIKLSGLTRYRESPEIGIDVVLDVAPGATCAFVRAHGHAFQMKFTGNYSARQSSAGGWVLSAAGKPSYWVPDSIFAHRLDHDGHILQRSEARPALSAATNSWISLLVEDSIPLLDAVIWKFDDPNLEAELEPRVPAERQAWFLWGSHTCYSKPADLYRHLIYGRVYENRVSWPRRWIICSENDAHALHVTLGGLALASGKRLYKILQSQLAASVVCRMGADGALRHGEWSDEMESHYRLHCSGLHLLMDQLLNGADETLKSALGRGTDFIARKFDNTAIGPWFLHDDLEQTVDGMNKSPFTWLPSTVLGKAPSNMLVLNTHVDCAIAIGRASQFLAEPTKADLFQKACRAVTAILELRPCERIYRFAFKLLEADWRPAGVEERTWSPACALIPPVARWLQRNLHRFRTRNPRLIMPNGYIDRGVSIQGVALPYHSINLMDLLRLRRREPAAVPDRVLREALQFGYRCFKRGFWSGQPSRQYALGFWVEALWHACMLYDNSEYRAWLAAGMLELEKRGMGLPPSLLGANGEALPPMYWTPLLITEDPRLRTANLSRQGAIEWLFVNPTHETVKIDFARTEASGLSFELSGSAGSGELTTLKPCSWLRIQGLR